MPRRLRLAHRLLLVWFGATALVLLIAGAAFFWQQSAQAESERRQRIDAAFSALNGQLAGRAAELAALSHALAGQRNVAATLRLFDRYFDPAGSNAATFDPPAQQLAHDIANVARAGQVDWVLLTGVHGPLAGYARNGDGGEALAFWSRRDGVEMVMAGDGTRGFAPSPQLPAYAPAGRLPDLAEPILDRCRLREGVALVGESPVTSTDVDGAPRQVGRVIVGRCLDQAFVDEITAKTGVGFAILGNGEAHSDTLPVLSAWRAATSAPAPAPATDLRLTAGQFRLQGYQTGIADIAMYDGERARFVFALDAARAANGSLTLATSGIVALGAAMLLMLAAGFSYVRRNLTDPLERLMTGVDALQQGRYETIRDVVARNEVGDLVRAFNDMSAGIRFREDELRKLSRAVEQSPTAVVITDPDGAVEYVNPAFVVTTGYPAEEVVGQNLRLLRAGDTPPEAYRELWRTIKAGETWRGDLRNRTKDGRLIWEHISISPILDSRGETIHFVAVREDITARKEAENRIQYLAYHDSLTDLPNRRLFHDRLEQVRTQHLRQARGFALLLLDLDHFKDVNDSAGHSIGDELLRQVARRIGATLRDTDTLSRLGGDEFAILQVGIQSPLDAVILAEKVLACFRSPFEIDGRVLHSRTSIGILVGSHDPYGADELMRRADIALYKAKDRGRGGYVFYDDSMTTQVLADAELIHELSGAIERRELYLLYQPQVELAGGRLAGIEALLRWRHPRLGEIPPLRFIPLAESRGMIADITRWVLMESCRQMHDWASRGFEPGSVAINVSGAQLNSSRDLELLRSALDHCELPQDVLELEFTESAFLNLDEDMVGWIAQLQAQSIRIAIDDFGTGYSSMTLLRRLHADTLKIDREFIKDMLTDANDAAIVRATIALARAFDLTIVAEGIEDAAQAEALRRLGCDLGQGYHFARPLAPDALEAAWSGRVREARRHKREPRPTQEQ